MAAARASAARVANSVITPRRISFSRWYADTLTHAGVCEPAPVRGCIIYKPHGYAAWDLIRTSLDARIRAMGASNVYFPLLVPLSFLSRERTHVAGFAAEAAVVTHSRLVGTAEGDSGGVVTVDPSSALAEPYVIRPTSESVIWDAFRRWIRTHTHLPLRINQWANVLRWERRPRPLTRNAEFMWQEGHTAHATADEARAYARDILDMYSSFFSSILAMPVVTGAKSPSERFAGAVDTYTCEAVMQNGWALQSATSHFLGDNFARAFDVQYTDAQSQRHYVHATSWGASTRMLGGVIMTHGDDTGLVLPPAIAPVQVAIVPIVPSKSASNAATAGDIVAAADQLRSTLAKAGLRAEIDRNVHDAVGARFYHWERKGTPLRIELGARDLAQGAATLKHRVGGLVRKLELSNPTPAAIQKELDDVHACLYHGALERHTAHVHRTTSYATLRDAALSTQRAAADRLSGVDAATVDATGGDSPDVDESDAPVFVAPWHEDAEEEARVKAETKYTIRCYPEECQRDAAGQKCFKTGRPATHMAMFARAF